MADPTKLGAKLGPRVADLMARAATSHLQSSADTRAKIELASKLGVFRTITAETRTTVAPLFRDLATDPDLEPWLRDFLHFLGHGSGEFQAIATSLIMGTSVEPSLGMLIGNALAPKIQNALAANPHSTLDAATAAGLVARGIWTFEHGSLEARRGAISDNRFSALADAAESQLDIGALLELLRRDELGRRAVFDRLRRQGFSGDSANEIIKLQRVHLEPVQAADMVLRGVISKERGHEIAKAAGVTPDDFDALVLDTGSPPAIDELLFLHRRGKIDRERLVHGIRQSRVRNEWIDAIEDLTHRPMDISSAVAAVVQNHLPESEGRRIAEENGLEPSQWTPLLETHGRPPGIQEMGSLYNRGVISKARFEQAIRESDIKNKYIPDLVEIRRHLLPQRTVVSLHSKGAFTDSEALTHLLQLGIVRADAEALVREGSATKTDGQKQLAEGTIMRLYEAATIDAATAKGALSALGYSDTEIGWIVAFADLRRVHAEREHAISTIRSRYVAHRIDDGETSGALDALHVPTGERDRLVSMWRLERDASTRQLTEAQVVKALKKQLISDDDAKTRLVRMGYAAGDADLLLAMA